MIQVYNQVKFLKVAVDSKLTWKPHVEYVLNKLAKYTSLVRNLKHIVTSMELLKVYVDWSNLSQDMASWHGVIRLRLKSCSLFRDV